MKKAWQLYQHNLSVQIKHWSSRQWLDLLWRLSLGTAVFILLYSRLDVYPPEKVWLLLIQMLIGIAGAGLLYTAVTSLRTWFSSPNAFYFSTAPLRFKEMYCYHWLDTMLGFVNRMGGHLFIPALIALSIRLQGIIWVLAALVLLAGWLSLAVNLGFWLAFFLIYHKDQPVWWGVLPLGFITAASALFLLGQVSPAALGTAGVFIWILVHWGVPGYGERVFRRCLDASGVSLNFTLNSPVLKKFILEQRFLPPIFRAFLYKELVTDRRSIFLYLRYLVAALCLFAYLPLSNLAAFEKGGLAGALVYCYLVIIANFHETFSTTFNKEGSMIGYLLPYSRSSWLGAAKLLSAVIEELPLLLLSTGLVWHRLSLSASAGISFGIALGLLTASHLGLVVALSANYLSLEHRETGLMGGMLYEYAWGGFNPRILAMYMGSLLVPAAWSGILLAANSRLPGAVTLSSIWVCNLFLVGFIVCCLYLQRYIFRRRFAQLSQLPN